MQSNLHITTDWSILGEMAQTTSFQSQRGRPRSFDMEVTVERAMQVFWSRGYHGTSLPDLLGATRLSRGSLYAAFGDKHGLFLRALDRYIDESLARLDVELNSQKSALGGLRACLAGYVDRTSGLGGKRGCLVVATAMELAAHDADVQKRIRWFFRAMEMRLTIAVTRAQGAGELVDDVEAPSIARLLVCAVEGLRVLGKTDLDKATWQSSVDLLLDRFIK
jgi:TetR/AcrR family transcriptional repressor of nem operon